MTKTEFAEQFKRLRVAGYRLPVFDGVSVKDVTDEWYGTFGNCSADEFSQAIDRLKQSKTDTFWPATGELWQHVFEVRKARRIRLQAMQADPVDTVPQTQRQELAAMFRGFAQQLSQRMSMPKVSEAVGQQEAADEALRDEEDLKRAAEGDVCG
jgi:hypothetical protein